MFASLMCYFLGFLTIVLQSVANSELDYYQCHIKNGLDIEQIGEWSNTLIEKQAQYIYITISTIMSVCPSVRSSVHYKKFFSLKLPWNYPLTPGVDPG